MSTEKKKAGAPIKIPEEIGDPFRDRIARIRRKYNLTTAKMAEILGVSDAAVSHWQKGKRKPSKMLLKLLDAKWPEPAENTPEAGAPKAQSPTRVARIISQYRGTVSDIAYRLKVTPAAVIHWQKGYRKPSAEHLKILDKIWPEDPSKPPEE
jgi:DNA-binding transcriptional regulator YiaG